MPQALRNVRRVMDVISGYVFENVMVGVLAKFPWRTERTGEQLAGLGVVQDALSFDIPLELAADEHGDQPQMARDGRVMGGLDRSNGRFARFDAVEEILPVI